MKTSRISLLIFTAIVLVVMLGSNDIKVKNVISFISKNDKPPSDFAVAHASLGSLKVNVDDMACKNGRPNTLLVPPPNEFFLQDYEKELFTFILDRGYDDWCMDKKVRDTGPWIEDNYYGVHPAVRIYYSPRMMYWLTGDPSYWKDAPGPINPREGEVPEGAMIVKEMFEPPADLYDELEKLMTKEGDPKCNEAYEKLIADLISSWTVMVRTNDRTADGWFWAGPSREDVNKMLDDHTAAPWAGFGLTCIRCHASAESGLTFSDTTNIKGIDPHAQLLQFRNDNTWRTDTLFKHPPLKQILSADCIDSNEVKQLFQLNQRLRQFLPKDIPGWADFRNHHEPPVDPSESEVNATALKKPNPLFTKTFIQKGINTSAVEKFPSEWADNVVPKPGEELQQYITSDNCLGCHGGLGGDPYDVAMFIKTGLNYGDGYNVSEYGEWRWSPMGLAGRDPIFYAQLESEMKLLERDAKVPNLLKGTLQENKNAVTNTCLSCHGSMGQRQLTLDARKDNTLDSNFQVDYVYLQEQLSKNDPVPPDQRYHTYGELAREGISCATCHHIDPPDPVKVASWRPGKGWLGMQASQVTRELSYFLFHNTTGRFETSPPDVLNGPLADVKTYPMEMALGIEPVHSDFIKSSQMCGTCHTINLPNIGLEKAKFPVLNAAEQNAAFKDYNHSIEQATFLEWQNSIFGVEKIDGKRNDQFQSCQNCHMPGGFKSLDGSIDIDQITTKIATIQDATYPEVEFAAADEDIGVVPRGDYNRHEHVGLNVFLLEMFNQFPDILGVSKQDYMTSATTGNALAIQNMVRQARESTIDLGISVKSPPKGNLLEVDVNVANKTGHRFPSGVSFRRAFIEVLVADGSGKVVWASGRTNEVGVILGADNQPLKSEFLPDEKNYQPHHLEITSQDQVQIYEELNQNMNREFTTSFVHRVYPIKDNRLLPKGWRQSDYFKQDGQVLYEFMEATDPEGVAKEKDPDYSNPSNSLDFKGEDNIKYKIQLPEGTSMRNLSVKVTMYSQAIPPYWLHQRFSTAPTEPGTKRLYYMTSRLNLKNTAMENWKLPLVSQTAKNKGAKGWVVSKENLQ